MASDDELASVEVASDEVASEDEVVSDDEVGSTVVCSGLHASLDWHLPPPLDCLASAQPDKFLT